MGAPRVLTRRGTIRAVGVIVLVGLAGMASAFEPASSPAFAVDACADADGNGDVTVTDGVEVLRAAAGLTTACTAFRCDVDGSGDITVTDGVGVLLRAADLRFGEFHHCPVPSTVHDFSAFASFHWARESAFGFCPQVGSVVTAALEQRPDRTYLADLAVAETRPLNDPQCVLPFLPDPFGDGTTCIAPASLPDRVLTEEEAARVRSVVAAVRINEARLPVCETTAFDPCVVVRAEWDGAAYRDQFCDGMWIASPDAAALAAAIDALVAPAGP